jgi:pantoate--beta-alanine ligase
MGYLHDGHLSLMREARHRANAGGRKGLSLATIFVNPTQFGPGEDLARYPRDLEGDLAKCGAAGVDAVLAPEDPASVYPEGFQTWIEVAEVSKGLCGDRRPGHFRGVATVVAKLFGLSRPHVALFGEKDWQQLQVLRRMAVDLDMGIEVVGMPIIREADGLAMSSRNAYLSPDERGRAVAISRALEAARGLAARGERDPARLASGIREALEGAGLRVDYVEVAHPETLRSVAVAAPGSRVLVAAFLGRTRLIDNVALP